MVTKSGAIRGGGIQTLAAGLGVGATVQARAVQFFGDAADSGINLIGGSTMNPGDASPLTAGTGFPIPKYGAGAQPLYLPPSGVWTDMYHFDQIYVYVAPGDVLYVLYEVG